MTTTKFYLDKRSSRHPAGTPYPLKLAINRKGQTAYLTLGVSLLPSQWDSRAGRIISHPEKQALNILINSCRTSAEIAIAELQTSGRIAGMSITKIRDYIANKGDGSSSKSSLEAQFAAFISTKAKGSRTREIYEGTLSRLRAYDRHLSSRALEDVDRSYLTAFDSFLARTSPSRNARNIHLRNIRAVFNFAIDEEVTTAYPFRRFKIRPEPTRKRSLSLETLRAFFSVPLEPWQEKYRDIFKLIFFLCGINIVDLLRLRKVIGGRIEYRRAKTGRLYSIKVEPEALDIITRLRGKAYLLYPLDRTHRYRTYAMILNRELAVISKLIPDCPKVTTYWARHTWATIAASLDIPKETIAAALGHGGHTVTDIYIDFDQRKVDAANRRVLDFVLYNRND